MLWNLDIFIIILPIIIGLYNYIYFTKSLKFLLIVIVFSGVIDFLAAFAGLGLDSKILLLNIYIPIYNFLWWLCYYSLFNKSKSIKRGLITSLIISSTIIGLFLIPWENQELNGLSLAISNIHILLLALFYLSYLAFRSQEFNLDKHPFFFVSSGLLIYHAFTVLIFASISSIGDSDQLLLWTLKGISQIILYLIIAYVFYNSRKTSD